MSNITTKDFFAKESVKAKFEELLGKRATGFITSVMQVTNGNNYLAKADPISIYNAAAMAATLDLPINNNLGFAWIVPYGNQAQFQIGWKGLVQLAQRTGQYKAINVIDVYENQFTSFNSLTEELKADFSIEGEGKIIGYVAYFRLVNGFEKTCYWSAEKVEKHGKRFSKSFSSGPWKTDFDAMAKKTVLKSTLSKWGILSIEMQNAFIADQAVIKDIDSMDISYPDNTTEDVSHTEEKPNMTDDEFQTAVNDGVSLEDLREEYAITPEQVKMFNEAKK